jgi:hypothetical protein
MNEIAELNVIERRFLNAVKHHLQGWKTKIENDFSFDSYNEEFKNLQSDPVYSKFGFDIPEYVLVRLIGRMSISIGRRLGEIYDKLPRFVAAARFNVTPQQVAEKFDGLELDIGLRYALLSREDVNHVTNILRRFGDDASNAIGVGIEIRYNFNPNDSARLRKDVALAGYLIEKNLLPVYLIYSAISPRDDAIARLKRAGWLFLQGNEAGQFTSDLFGTNFLALLDRDDVRKEIHDEVRGIMRSIFESDGFSKLELDLVKISSEHRQ